jgi:hypothetical protein
LLIELLLKIANSLHPVSTGIPPREVPSARAEEVKINTIGPQPLTWRDMRRGDTK